MTKSRAIQILDGNNEVEKFKNDKSINNAIEIVLGTSKDYDNMIKYAQQYKKSKSKTDLNEFSSLIYRFRSHVAMYMLQVDSLDDDGKSLNEKINSYK